VWEAGETNGDILELKSDQSSSKTKADNTKPRIIYGLGDFYRQHSLQVNDTIYLKYDSEKDVIQITPKRRHKKVDFNDQSAVRNLVDTVANSSKPLSETDIHGLFPDLPHNFDLNRLFRQDNRILKVDGRWQNSAIVPARQVSKPETEKPKVEAKQAEVQEEAILVGGPQAELTTEGASAQLRSPNDALGRNASERIEAFHNVNQNQDNQTKGNQNQGTQTNNLGSQTLRESISKNRPAFFAPNTTESEPKRNAGSGMQEISSSISGVSKGPVANIPETSFTEDKPIEFTGDYAALHKQAREKLEPLGFSVSSIEQGQLLLKADLGRDNYSVLMYLMPDANGLNWPSALAQRRKTEVSYLSVLGNAHDLLQVDNSASFLRTTMWSWQALDRILQINEHMDVGPAELEPCFRETGLDFPQVEVFQNLLNQHLQEVGLFSQIIHSLGSRKVPSIFVLDDIMTELDSYGSTTTRESVASTLKTLSQVPFNLIQSTDNHEFVISKDISTGLSRLESYCSSLKSSLPERTGVERISAATDEPSDLL